MNVQIQHGQWRLRLLADELAQLCAGSAVTCLCPVPGGLSLGFSANLVPQNTATVSREDELWRIHLPQDVVRALQQRLPNRDGIAFDLEADALSPFRVVLQIDIHEGKPRGS